MKYLGEHPGEVVQGFVGGLLSKSTQFAISSPAATRHVTVLLVLAETTHTVGAAESGPWARVRLWLKSGTSWWADWGYIEQASRVRSAQAGSAFAEVWRPSCKQAMRSIRWPGY